MGASDSLLEQLLGVEEEGTIPTILVRRQLPHKMTTKFHESGWIGLRRSVRAGKTSFEKDHNFKLVIDPKGLARIPDCEENRERLERLCKPRTKLEPVKEKNARGVLVKKKDKTGKTVFQEVNIEPLYERMDVSRFSKGLLDAVIDRMEERNRERENEDLGDAEDIKAAPHAGRTTPKVAATRTAKVPGSKKADKVVDEE